MKSEVDNVAAGIEHLTVSGKRKRTTLAKTELERLNREQIRELNVNRDYILQNQPWASRELPRGYLPDPSTKWYPPIFCLGVDLSVQEMAEFAKHLGLLSDKGTIHRNRISTRLTEVCGAKRRIMAERCDVGGSPDDDRIWLFSLATNYDISRGRNVNEPLRKYREIVEKAFGSSKKVMWWLEYTTNHAPGHWWWVSHKPEWIDGWDPVWAYRPGA